MEDPNTLEPFEEEEIVALRDKGELFKVFYRYTPSKKLRYFADVDFKTRTCQLRESLLKFDNVRCLEYLLFHFKKDPTVDGISVGIRINDLPSILVKSEDFYMITEW